VMPRHVGGVRHGPNKSGFKGSSVAVMPRHVGGVRPVELRLVSCAMASRSDAPPRGRGETCNDCGTSAFIRVAVMPRHVGGVRPPLPSFRSTSWPVAVMPRHVGGVRRVLARPLRPATACRSDAPPRGRGETSHAHHEPTNH